FSTSLERTLVAQSVEILHGKRNDKGARGVPLFGRDCVARRAPRNKSNDLTVRSEGQNAMR
ncbi:MAG: hypothetical protein LBL66_07080, partial [Clostridiales bacterium]|nr:hypothetical protein [Clostridiales bacterium]